MESRELFLFVGALCTLNACTPNVERYFERTPLPEGVIPFYDEAAAFTVRQPSEKQAQARLDLGFLARGMQVDAASIVPFDENYWYEPTLVKLTRNAATVDLSLNRDFLAVLDLGETARNNYQAFSQFGAAKGLVPGDLRPRICHLILCAPEPYSVDTIGERLPELGNLPIDIRTILPPVVVGPINRSPGTICDDCFERPPNILPCLTWKWCGDFPIRRKMHVRKNIYSLSPTEISTLRNGVAVMKARNPTDPTSWLYQARMHAVDSGTAAALQDQCQHRQFLFFSWHRMYVYYFERILRKASGVPNFALPYWNYTDSPSEGAIPEAYRLPADLASNSLYNDTRQAAYNAGAALPPADVSYAAGFSLTDFTTTNAGVPTFGGRTVSAPMHFPVPSPGSGRIEQSPHNNVHNDISGDMASGESPRDPVFWLHHSNIDRLWKRWIALGNERSNPTGDSFWMSHVFDFFDENGSQVALTGAQILDTVNQLGYRYDDDPLVIWPSLEFVLTMAPQRKFLPDEVLATVTRPVRLGDRRVDVQVPVPEQGRVALAETVQEDSANDRLVLQLKNIEYDEPVGVTYLLFLNLAAAAEARNPDHTHPSFIGTLGFFGGSHHAGEPATGVAEEYDVTRVIRREGIPDRLVLTAIPSLPTAPEDRKDLQELIAKIKAKGNPRFGEIVLLRVRAE